MFAPMDAVHVIAMSVANKALFKHAVIVDAPESDALTPVTRNIVEGDPRDFEQYRVAFYLYVHNNPEVQRLIEIAKRAPTDRLNPRKINQDLNRIVVASLEGVITLDSITNVAEVSPKSIMVVYHGRFFRGKAAIEYFQQD